MDLEEIFGMFFVIAISLLLGCKIGAFVDVKYHTIEKAVEECKAAGGLQSVDYSGSFTCSNGLEGKINK